MTETKKVERAAAQATASREALRAAIREAHAAGMSLRAIGTAAGLSHEEVRRIVSAVRLPDPKCVPLCGASQAYGRFDAPWKHEPECPVRLEWEKQRKLARSPN